MPQKTATYEGPSATIYVDGVRLNQGVPTPVGDDLAGELREGSERLKGHKFKVEGEKKAASPSTKTKTAASGRKVS